MLEVAAGLRPSPPACAAQRGARREDGACLAASVSCHGPEQLDACRQLPPARLRPRRLSPHSCRGQCIVSNSLETVTVKDTRGTLAVPPHSWPPWPPQPWTAAAAIAVCCRGRQLPTASNSIASRVPYLSSRTLGLCCRGRQLVACKISCYQYLVPARGGGRLVQSRLAACVFAGR